MNDIFLAITQKTSNYPNENRPKIQIYKWLGRHFDIIQYIDTFEPRKIIEFKIGHIQYLAVANHRDSSGNFENKIFI